MQRLENTLAGLPLATQAELSQLLALLGSTVGRLGLAGLHSDWPEASVTDLQEALQGMRTSGLAMRQQVYHALRDLTNAEDEAFRYGLAVRVAEHRHGRRIRVGQDVRQLRRADVVVRQLVAEDHVLVPEQLRHRVVRWQPGRYALE